MDDPKEHIISRVRRALVDVPDGEQPSDVPLPREYRQTGNRPPEKRIALFVGRLSEYKATTKRVDQSELKAAVGQSCNDENIDRLVVPDGFPREWIPETATPLFDKAESPLINRDLAEADGVISTCALGLAQTGTIILGGGKGQGRRALTLLPDYHLCIVRESQVVELVPEGFGRLKASAKNEGPPITLISGPSATSDIELNRVEGVHGPRKLEVLIIS